MHERSHEAAVDYLWRECDGLRHELAQQQAQVRASDDIIHRTGILSARLCDRMQRVLNRSSRKLSMRSSARRDL